MDLLHRCGAFSTAIAIMGCAMVYADQPASPETATDNDQVRRLMHPTAAELASEESGRVYIYDGLEANAVNAALDRYFERIENMMFTRIHHLPPTGAGPVEIEDDGCD